MKKLIVLMFAVTGILSGCIAYDEPYRDEPMHHADHDRDYGDHHRGYEADRNHDADRDHDHDHDHDWDHR
jgi:Cd2+/Zn2+-exporting ATPase